MIAAQNVTAIAADSFVESIGINTQWVYPGIYANNYTGLKLKLVELGIRYVRNRALPEVYVRTNDLYKSLAIKTLMITGPYKSGLDQRIFDSTQINAELNEMKAQALLKNVLLEGLIA